MWKFVALVALTVCLCDAQLAGGFTEQDINDKEIKALASRSLARFNAQNNGPTHELVELVSARSQVVAGIHYELKLKLKNRTGDKCVIADIFSQAWTNTEDISFKDC